MKPKTQSIVFKKIIKNWTSLDLKKYPPNVIILERKEASMDTPFKPEVILENLGPDVTSYIYQIILEFEPFTTPETVVSVVAKNPLDLLTTQNEDNETENILTDFETLPSRTKLKKMYRIAITITDSGTSLSAEGLHQNIFEAIRIAKDKLVKTLSEIQDDVISNQDRHIQIRHALAAGGSVH